MEKILGTIQNVQTKPPGNWTQKSCDLIFTDERLLCVKVGASSLIATMLGGGIAGPSGAIAFSIDNQTQQDINREKQKNHDLNQLLASDEQNYMIWYSNVESGSFKTDFFSTLGIMAPLEIKTIDGDKYFYNIYNQQKEYAKALIDATMPVVKT